MKAVNNACPTANAQVSTQATSLASFETQGQPPVQIRATHKFNVNAKAFISGKQLKKDNDVGTPLNNEVDSIQSAIETMADRVEALKKQLEKTQTRGECIVEQAVTVLEENVMLTKKLFDLKKQVKLNAAKLENYGVDCSFTTNTITEREQIRKPMLPSIAELASPQEQEMDLIDRLDLIGFRGIHY